MPYVKTRDGVPIYVEKLGNGKETIVFIHPPGMGHVTYKQQKPLSERYTILLIDLRGNGKSGLNKTPLTFRLLANDIFDILNYFQIKEVVLCGYSNGASIALEFP